jgi:hypothetical protein
LLICVENFRHLLGCHLAVRIVIDHHRRRERTRADTGDRLQRVLEVCSALAGLYPQLLLYLLEDPGSATHVACRTPAYPNYVPAGGDELELGVEGGNPKDGYLWHADEFCDSCYRLFRYIAEPKLYLLEYRDELTFFTFE